MRINTTELTTSIQLVVLRALWVPGTAKRVRTGLGTITMTPASHLELERQIPQMHKYDGQVIRPVHSAR